MEHENIHTAADGLLEKLRSNTLSSNDLLGFAKKHAVDPKLVNEALVLQLHYFSTSPEKRLELAAEVERLIEKICRDAAAENSLETLLNIEKQKEQARKHFQALKPGEEVVVELKGIGKKYTGRNGFKLEPLDLKFHLGEITGIIGANATGKSTLLRMITGLLLKTSGDIDFPYFRKNQQKPLAWSDVKHMASYIPQALPEWRAGLRTTLQYEAAVHGILGKNCDREVDFILERLGLSNDADAKNWHELSGGYKLRFALAKALVWQPSLLVLDEPLANLDAASQIVILNDLRNLAHSFRHPICVIITSQHIHEIENVADRLILLDNGKLRHEGKPGQFGTNNDFNLFEFGSSLPADALKNRLLPATYLRLDDVGFHYLLRTPKTVDAQTLLRQLSDAHIPVDYFRDISHSVKQIFYETPSNT